MRIAIITTDGRDLLKRYHEKVPAFGTAPEALLQGFARMPEVEIHVISLVRQPVVSPEKLYPNVYFHTVIVPKIGWMRTAYQGCIRAVRKKLKEIRPDIVHGQGTERDCAISAVFSGFPNVLTIHGNMRLIARLNGARPFSFPWLAARLERMTIPRSQGIVCITHYTQNAVAGLARKSWIVPNAVDETFFDLQSAPNNLPMVLCVGHVCLRKNQNNFIRSLDPLAATTRFQVIFLGGANREQPYDNEFFQLIETRPWCVYGGFADREKLKTYFQKATVLALPSLEDNCPMVVLEAMAAGVPVMAAKVGGIPELIEEKETGVFCNPLDASSMNAGVAQLLNDPDAASRMALVAKRKARDRFHPIVIARRHLEIYREVLSKPS